MTDSSILPDSVSLNDPRHATEELLREIASRRRPIIAIDLDDVLCQTCVCAAECERQSSSYSTAAGSITINGAKGITDDTEAT